MPSYIILGAGVFGASTAYHLIQKHPDATVTLVDRTQGSCEVGASWDWNKVVRADYEDAFYMAIALEALDLWSNDPLYSQFFHQSGAAWLMADPEYPTRLANNYRNLGRELDFEIIRPAELRKRYTGLFDETDFGGVGDIFLNRSSGWAEAKAAMNAVIDQAVKAGVRNVAIDVASLIFDDCGACTGLKGMNGEILRADRIILCTGAYTAKLIADSAPERNDIQVGYRLTAAAVTEGLFKLDPARVNKFKKGPVFVHNVGEIMGETMPPTEGGLLKFIRDVTFRNTSIHQKLGQPLSAPPVGFDYSQWSPPDGLKAELEVVRKGIYGTLTTDIPFETYRVCWDAISPDVDFIITPHPRCQGLYIATGGSFHGWKFLPVIGKYVVDMLHNNLTDECSKRWAWDRPVPAVPKGYAPKRELSDI